MVLCVGLDQALVRYFYEKKTEEYKRKLLLKCIVLPVLLSLIASVAFVLLTQFKIIQFEFDMLCTVLLCIYVRNSKLPVNADTTEYTYEAIGP